MVDLTPLILLCFFALLLPLPLDPPDVDEPRDDTRRPDLW